MFSLDFVGAQVAFNRWALPLNVDVDRLHPARFQVYVSLLCLHLAFMGAAAFSPLRLPHVIPRPRNSPFRAADFCAGIGHLIYHFQPLQEQIEFDAWEMEDLCVRVGRKLFPWVNWHHQIPFYAVKDIEGRYDLVVGNPPLGTIRGMMPGQQMNKERSRRSEYIFLELFIRALKPGGQALILAPYNYLDKLPKKLRSWLDERARLQRSWGPLPGRFMLTNMRLHAWHLIRRPQPATPPTPAPTPPAPSPAAPVQLPLFTTP